VSQQKPPYYGKIRIASRNQQQKNRVKQTFLFIAAINGMIVVALGAFGAHALQDILDDYSLGVWQTAVQYQMFHTVALLAVQWMIFHGREARGLVQAGYAFVTGIVLFSGSLYLLALTGQRWLGMVTPLGGVAFLAGWVLLSINCWRHR
jgi:uncharacterized membrane protein YgdD (TMEM256/DUF423 family)